MRLRGAIPLRAAPRSTSAQWPRPSHSALSARELLSPPRFQVPRRSPDDPGERGDEMPNTSQRFKRLSFSLALALAVSSAAGAGARAFPTSTDEARALAKAQITVDPTSEIAVAKRAVSSTDEARALAGSFSYPSSSEEVTMVTSTDEARAAAGWAQSVSLQSERPSGGHSAASPSE